MATLRRSPILVETTILVDYLRGANAAADYLDAARADADLVCSLVTAAELIVGAQSRAELRAIDKLLARFQEALIDRHDSVRALKWLKKYYYSHATGFHDCLLAAAALRLHAPIVTLNEKHFRVLPGVQVIRPY